MDSKNFILLRDFENSRSFEKLFNDTLKNIPFQNNLPNNKLYPYISDIYIDNVLYKVVFKKFVNIFNKYIYKVLYNYTPNMNNIKDINNYRDILTPHYNMSYFDGNYINIYASNYLESIDFLLLILTKYHHFKGILDIDGYRYKEVKNRITSDKSIYNNDNKYIINQLYHS